MASFYEGRWAIYRVEVPKVGYTPERYWEYGMPMLARERTTRQKNALKKLRKLAKRYGVEVTHSHGREGTDAEDARYRESARMEEKR